MAVISIFTASKRARPNKCAPYVLRRGGGLWFLWVNISRTVCVLNIFSSTKQSKSKWMESFFFSWTPLRSSWYSVIYVLSLMWGLGRPTPHLFWSHRSDGDSISQSHCLSSHISVLAYPCSVGNIKTPHFLLPIQSHICHFQTQVCKRGWVWGLWCSGSMQTPPWSQGEVSALHGWGGSGASSLYALLLVRWLITLD